VGKLYPLAGAGEDDGVVADYIPGPYGLYAYLLGGAAAFWLIRMQLKREDSPADNANS